MFTSTCAPPPRQRSLKALRALANPHLPPHPSSQHHLSTPPAKSFNPPPNNSVQIRGSRTLNVPSSPSRKSGSASLGSTTGHRTARIGPYTNRHGSVSGEHGQASTWVSAATHVTRATHVSEHVDTRPEDGGAPKRGFGSGKGALGNDKWGIGEGKGALETQSRARPSEGSSLAAW
eukprot:3769381-Rhodomonas_salina.1